MKLKFLLVSSALTSLIPAILTGALALSAVTAQAQTPTVPTPAPVGHGPTAASDAAAAAAANGDAKLIPPVWTNTDTQFLNQYPHLKDNIYQEPESHFNLGLSIGIIGLVSNRLIFTGNFFQAHYITQRWDYELINISYGVTTAHPSNIRSNHFVFRTSPKYRINRTISAGPLLGYEFVNFPTVTDVLYKNSEQTQNEPFSSSGVIYGAEVAETFHLDNGWLVRLTEVGYEESYSVKDAGNGWTYLYGDRSLRTDPSPLKAGFVGEIELGVLF